MNEVLHANIFFLIASIATVVFCILISIILYHVLKIIKSLRSIIERIEAGSERIAEDVANVRQLVTSGGIFSKIFQFIINSTGASNKKTRNSRTKD